MSAGSLFRRVHPVKQSSDCGDVKLIRKLASDALDTKDVTGFDMRAVIKIASLHEAAAFNLQLGQSYSSSVASKPYSGCGSAHVFFSFTPCFLTWGLIPSWSSDGKGFINARCETLESKPSFTESFQRRRCLILADGFFEWKGLGRVK